MVAAPPPDACKPSLFGKLPADCPSFIRITVKTHVLDVIGYFHVFHGEIDLDPKKPEAAHISMQADTGSVDTGIAVRDKHLRSEDFFNSDVNPAAIFVSTGIEQAHGDGFVLLGNLTVNKIVLPARFTVKKLKAWTDDGGKARIRYSAQTTIDRKSYALDWNAGTSFRTEEDARDDPGFHIGDIRHSIGDAYISDDKVLLEIQLEGVSP